MVPPTETPPRPTAADFAELGAKYRTLAGWRVRRDADDQAPRGALRALATRFPGCLRELDLLSADALLVRARSAEAAAAGAAPEPWLLWIWAYHRLLSAALLVKRALGPRSRAGAAALSNDALVARASSVAGWPLRDGFVAAVSRPPQGRLVALVLQELATLSGVPATQLGDTLFPPRRRPAGPLRPS